MTNMESEFNSIKLAVDETLGNLCEFAFLLGSAATPRFNKESDVDIAVFWKNDGLDFTMKTKIHMELEDKLGHNVDLVDLNHIDVIFGIQVFDTGRILINNDPGQLLNWKAKQLSTYPDFKASRAIIEDNILNRKKYV